VLVASRFSMPVAVVPWAEMRGRVTVLVKLSYEVHADGSVTFAGRHDPLTPDTASQEGVLLFPSDFVRKKARCDVILVGRVVTMPPARTRLKLLTVSKIVDHAASLGPIAVLSSADTRVQHAPLDQRVPHARLPFRFLYERDDVVLDAVIPGPTPQLGFVRGDRIELQRAVIDTVALDPGRRRVMISLRAVIDGIELHTNSMVVVDDLARLEHETTAAFTWPRTEAVLPGIASSTAARRSERPGASTFDDDPMTVTSEDDWIDLGSTSSGGSSEVSMDETVTLSEELGQAFAAETTAGASSEGFARSGVFTLPFKSVVEGPSRGATSSSTAAMRLADAGAALPFIKKPAAAPAPAAPAWDEETADSGVFVPAAPASSPLPFAAAARPAVATPPMAPASARSVSLMASSLPFVQDASQRRSGFDLKPFAPEPPAEPLEKQSITLDGFAAIKAQLWAGTEPRRAVLQRHGLTEFRWRVLERTLAPSVGDSKEDDRRVLAVLSSLRHELRSRSRSC